MAYEPMTSAKSSEEVRRRIEAASRERGPQLDLSSFYEVRRKRSPMPSSSLGGHMRSLRSPNVPSLNKTNNARKVSSSWSQQRYVPKRFLIQLLLSAMLFAIAFGFQRMPAPLSTYARQAVTWLFTESVDPSTFLPGMQNVPAIQSVRERLSPWIPSMGMSGPAYTRPVQGKLIRGYGEIVQSGQRVLHPGVDLSVVPGESVRTVEAGTVLKVGYEGTTYGLFVLVQHDGWQGLYANLESAVVQEGDELRAAELMGTAGGMGESDGEWIHIEAYLDGKPVDPTPYLRPYRER